MTPVRKCKLLLTWLPFLTQHGPLSSAFPVSRWRGHQPVPRQTTPKTWALLKDVTALVLRRPAPRCYTSLLSAQQWQGRVEAAIDGDPSRLLGCMLENNLFLLQYLKHCIPFTHTVYFMEKYFCSALWSLKYLADSIEQRLNSRIKRNLNDSA